MARLKLINDPRLPMPLVLGKNQSLESVVSVYQRNGIYEPLSPAPLDSGLKTDFLFPDQLGNLVRRSSCRRIHRKNCDHEPVDKPKFGIGGGRSAGARAATHYRSHVKGGYISPETLPEDCYICDIGLRKAIQKQKAHIYNPWSDRILIQYQLSQEIEESFCEDPRTSTFIGRWLKLSDTVKHRYLRFVSFYTRLINNQSKRPHENIIQRYSDHESRMLDVII